MNIQDAKIRWEFPTLALTHTCKRGTDVFVTDLEREPQGQYELPEGLACPGAAIVGLVDNVADVPQVVLTERESGKSLSFPTDGPDSDMLKKHCADLMVRMLRPQDLWFSGLSPRAIPQARRSPFPAPTTSGISTLSAGPRTLSANPSCSHTRPRQALRFTRSQCDCLLPGDSPWSFTRTRTASVHFARPSAKPKAPTPPPLLILQ